MVKFGPSSTDELFIEQGYKDFVDMPKWISENYNLTALEYPFNLGIHLSDEKAKQIGEQAKKYNIEMSAHAPYYINFANPSEDFEVKNNAYIISCLKKLKLMNGKRLVIHLGTQGKMQRDDAINLIKTRLEKLKLVLDENNFFDVMLCSETMGKYTYIGNHTELAPLTKLDKRFNLTLDFGHINCLMQGALKEEKDYQKIFDEIEKYLPQEKINNIHIHFSHIIYNEKGEMKHTTFEDFNEPEFEPLARIIKKKNINPVIICESKTTQARDANKMLKIFEKTL